MARALDIDDAMNPGMHVGASSIPTALAAAELAGGCSGKEFLTAIATGQDVAARINFATTYEGFEPTWDASGVCGIFASTIAAGRILHLNSAQMWNALGLISPARGESTGNCRQDLAVRLFQGCISRNSILCVRFAQKGFTGRRTFGRSVGYSHLYSRDQFDSGFWFGNLEKGLSWTNRFKSYPSCGATIASTDAILSW
jgi:2-methylcitrate dehydratase PrpD